MSSIQDFESAVSSKFAGANVRLVQRDYPELVRHIEQMQQVLRDHKRGSVRLAYDDVDPEVVFFMLDWRESFGRELKLRWIITHNALVWQRASGTLTYPLLTTEYIHHKARDVFIAALNADVAAVVNN